MNEYADIMMECNMENAYELYARFKHHVGTQDIDGKLITLRRLLDWALKGNEDDLLCIFCGSPATSNNNFPICPRCHEFKGLYPNC